MQARRLSDVQSSVDAAAAVLNTEGSVARTRRFWSDMTVSASAVWTMVRPAWWLWVWLAGSLTWAAAPTIVNAIVAFGWMVLIHRFTDESDDDLLEPPRSPAIELFIA